MFEGFTAWLFLPLGIVLGWVLRARVPASSSGTTLLPGEAASGLAQNLDDDPDRAIVSLLKASELDAEAVELHLTLGALFRKRGEVDRALRIHESLAARPNLGPALQQRARYELAQSYLKAGLMDRAESLLQQLAQRGDYAVAALEGMLTIYEQAHDWVQAIEASQQLERVSAQPRREITAQYWCELADEAHRRKEGAVALNHVRRALEVHPECVRASLIQGALLEEAKDYAGAIKALQRVAEQDRRFLPEAVAPLLRCAREAGDVEGFIDFMREAEPEAPPSAAVVEQAQLMRGAGMSPARYLAESFSANPSSALLEQLVETLPRPEDPSMAQALDTLRDALRGIAATRLRYRCTSCGLTPGLLFWQCPTCKQWGSVVPTDDRLPLKAAAAN